MCAAKIFAKTKREREFVASWTTNIIHDDLVVPVKPKKNITSSIEVRQSKILLRKT